MSYFHRPDARLDEQDAPSDSPRSPFASPEAPRSRFGPADAPRSPFADYAARFANWVTGADRIAEPPDADYYEPARDPVREVSPDSAAPPAPEPESDVASRFPVAPFGYNRAVVDEHLIGLERELAELRAASEPPVSVTDELERIGEQTASILVVAHDQAHETTRLAQEQADRCVADAAANAVAITTEAKERLRELDGETDSVWRERERLLDDVRTVSAALATLADEASERFPAAEQAAVPQRAQAFSSSSGLQDTEAFPMAFGGQSTEAFPMASDSEEPAQPESSPGHKETQPGDTGSWLAGLEPPDQQTQ
jgi:hypothetical protein